MSLYRTLFPKKHTFLAVVHVEDADQTLRNVTVARECGADGAFLINHSVSSHELVTFFHLAHATYPDFWLGVNMLNMDPMSAYDHMPTADGLWVDDAGIRNSGDCSEARAFHMTCLSRERQWLYFGGVAFKYQEHINDPAHAARLAVPFVDVITTSGDGTGKAADVDKIRLMKEAIGDHPLAVASGISPENVHHYLPYADCFLVATGVSDSDTDLNPERVRMLADALR